LKTGDYRREGTMPQFRNREEYEKWRAERMGGQGPSSHTNIRQEKFQSPQTDRVVQASQKPPARQIPNSFEAPEPLQALSPETGPLSNLPPRRQSLRSFGELFSDTWDLFKARFLTLIGLYLLSVLFMVVVTGFFAGSGFLLIPMVSAGKYVVIAGLIIMCMIAGSVAMSWGLASLTFATVDETLGIREALGRGWEKVQGFICVSSLFGFIVGGGFLLFLVPGVIFLVWFLFSQLIVVAENERGMDALLKSREYVRDHWFSVFVRASVIWLVSMGLSFLPVIGPILVILFVPFMLIFIKLVYDDLRDLKGEAAPQSYSMGARFKWIGAGAVGYVVFPIILFAVMGGTLIGSLLSLG
jgi:hypothetical protein